MGCLLADRLSLLVDIFIETRFLALVPRVAFDLENSLLVSLAVFRNLAAGCTRGHSLVTDWSTSLGHYRLWHGSIDDLRPMTTEENALILGDCSILVLVCNVKVGGIGVLLCGSEWFECVRLAIDRRALHKLGHVEACRSFMKAFAPSGVGCSSRSYRFKFVIQTLSIFWVSHDILT